MSAVERVERPLALDPQADPRRWRQAELAGELADLVGVVAGDLVERVLDEVPVATGDRPRLRVQPGRLGVAADRLAVAAQDVGVGGPDDARCGACRAAPAARRPWPRRPCRPASSGTSAEGIGSCRLSRLGRVSPRRRLTLVGVGAGPRLPIDPLRRPPGEGLPALDRDLDVLGVDLHRVAAPAEGLGRHERRARPGERLVHRLARPEVVADRDLGEEHRLLGRVVLLVLLASRPRSAWARAPARSSPGRARR